MHKFTEKEIGDMAVRALQLEAGTTPKPGLVDRDNSGAHRDMDYPMFLASSEALRPCFTACAETGADADKLRQIGIKGESAMFQTTNHVNTHKGLIFSMGILCGALGELSRSNFSFDEKDVQGLCRKIAGELLSKDTAKDTHGLRVSETCGIKGIRGEALSGFESVFDMSLMALRDAVKEGYSFTQAMIRSLLVLMTKTEDSNVVHRGGAKGLVWIRKSAEEILKKADLRDNDGLELVRAFDRSCIEKNLSPGGSADLLALTAMLYLFFEEKEKRENDERKSMGWNDGIQ